MLRDYICIRVKALLTMRYDRFGWMFAASENGYKFKVGYLGQDFIETYKSALAWQQGLHPNQLLSARIKARKEELAN